MQNGGPVAFYEIAATLIPVLFLGGVLLDNMHPPDLEELEKGVSSRWRMSLFMIVVYYLPLAGVFVLLAEAVALDAVVNRTTDVFHALVVCIALLVGMVAVVAAVWVPWALKIGDWADRELDISARAVFVASVVILVMGVVGLALQPWVTSPFDQLVKGVERGETRSAPEGALDASAERTWLEHLIATSDFRVDRLEAERANAADRAARLRVSAHLRLQRQTQRRQLEALEDLPEGDAAQRIASGVKR
jgi:hypothetical protein